MSEPVGDIGNSVQPFSQALRELMEKRKISYRMLATRTKLSAGYLNHLACGSRAVPSDQVIKILAKALRVKPEHFFEYRQRGLQRELYRAPEVADRLYDFLVADKPLAKDIRVAIESIKKR
jgi:transcriptional regulator with XRE-family HTH domain